MSEETSNTRKAAIALGGVAGGVALGGVAYQSEADRALAPLVNHALDREAVRNDLESRLLHDAAYADPQLNAKVETVFQGDTFKAKREAFQQTGAYEVLNSSEEGLRYMEMPELVEHVDFHEMPRGGLSAEVKLNELGLHGITEETAKKSGLRNAKFNAAGEAVEGSYFAHYVNAPYASVLEEVYVPEVGKHVHRLRGGVSKEWLHEAEAGIGEARLLLDKKHIREYAKMYRESAPLSAALPHLDGNAKLNISMAVVAGMGAALWLGETLLGKHTKAVTAQAGAETSQTRA